VEITQEPLPKVQPSVNLRLTPEEATILREFFGNLDWQTVDRIMQRTNAFRTWRLTYEIFDKLDDLKY
jgi:hypothetical protein